MFEPFNIEKKDYPYHFWMLQLVVFIYTFIRLFSRDYSVYGIIPNEFFNYHRAHSSLYPSFVQELLNTHFVYWFLEFPEPKTILFAQKLGIVVSTLGLLGFYSRLCSIFLFLLLAHLTGFIQATNAEVDGGTILLISLLVMSLTPAHCFYRFSLTQNTEKSVDNRVSIFLIFLSVGSFYSMAGLNKLIDVGPQWPFVLSLNNLSAISMEESVFASSRYANFEFSKFITNLGSFFSVLGGFFTIIGELFFITILFFPRLRLFLILNMIFLHFSVYYMTGINFTGSSFILLICLDWNSLFRKSTIFYNIESSKFNTLVLLIRKIDIFKRIEFKYQKLDHNFKIKYNSKNTSLLYIYDESGVTYQKFDLLEILSHKIPFIYPFALIFKIPFLHILTRYLHRIFLRKYFSI
jgi:hypothetical protein